MTPPEPSPQHQWLQQLLGAWTCHAEPVPNMPEYPMEGTEDGEMVG